MSRFLSDIKQPATVRVKSVSGTDSIRLLEMGVTPGISLEVIRMAPLGFPIEVKVRGYLLSLRKSEAHCIEIE